MSPARNPVLASRRTLMTAIAGASTSGPLSALAARQSLALDLRSPADNLLGLIKLMGSVDPEQLTYLWAVGQVTAVAEGKAATPLFDVQVCRLSYYRPLPGDIYAHRFWSCLFFIDPVSGELLDDWVNPLTQQRVKPGHYRGGPLDVLYRPDGIRTPDKPDTNPLSDAGLNPWIMPWMRSGDDVWCTFDSNFGLENYDTYVFRGSWRALVDRSLKSVPAGYTYYGASRYYRWLGMGDRQGYLRWRMSGDKAFRVDDLPASLQRFSAARFPGLLENPRQFTERAVIYRPEGTEPHADVAPAEQR